MDERGREIVVAMDEAIRRQVGILGDEAMRRVWEEFHSLFGP